jgi:hypothetical protein
MGSGLVAQMMIGFRPGSGLVQMMAIKRYVKLCQAIIILFFQRKVNTDSQYALK